ncbi:MAG: hypothetical protein AAF713_17590 [Pseudomonadota bacterium]
MQDEDPPVDQMGSAGTFSGLNDAPGIDQISADLFKGRTRQVDRLFAAAGFRSPLLLWSPNQMQLGDRAFLPLSQLAERHGGVLRDRDFFASDLAASRDWLMVLRAIGLGSDFEYEHYGNGIIDHYGQDLTGQRTSRIGGHISQFFLALYRAAMYRKESFLSEHQPPGAVFVSRWRRYGVPILDDAGQVVRFAVINRPENQLRAGLAMVPLPCVVADDSQIVCYSNDAFLRMRPSVGAGRLGITLEKALGAPVTLPASPAELAYPVPSTVEQAMTITGPDGSATEIQATIGGAEHGGMPFYVIVLHRLPQPG